MSKNSFYILICLVLCFYSCKKENGPIVQANTPFDHKSYLLSHPNSVPTLEIKFDQPDSLFFDELNRKILPNGCETFKDFNIKIDSLTIAARLQQPCENSIYCGVKNVVQILINSNHKILLEEEIVTDSLELLSITDQIISDKKEIYSYKKRTELSFDRDKKAHEEISKTVLNTFIQSYIKYMDSLSVLNFNKNLGRLSLQELDHIRKERILVLKYWNYPETKIPQRQRLVKLVSDLEIEN